MSRQTSRSTRAGKDTFAGSAPGILYRRRGQWAARLYARGDLASARGTLDLDIDPSRPHRGLLEIELDIFDTVRGELIPSVWYFDSEQQARDWSLPRPDPHTFILRFPVDDCESSALPLAPDEPSTLLGGRTPLDVLAEAKSKLANLGPYQGRWRDEALTEVSVDIEAIAPTTLCASGIEPSRPLGGDEASLPYGWDTATTRVEGWSGARVRSADRGLDFASNSIAIDVFTEMGELRALRLSRFDYSIDKVELQARIGLELEVAGSAVLQAEAQVDFTFPPGSPVTVDGHVQVFEEIGASGRRIECVGWPLDGLHEQDCQYE